MSGTSQLCIVLAPGGRHVLAAALLAMLAILLVDSGCSQHAAAPYNPLDPNTVTVGSCCIAGLSDFPFHAIAYYEMDGKPGTEEYSKSFYETKLIVTDRQGSILYQTDEYDRISSLYSMNIPADNYIDSSPVVVVLKWGVSECDILQWSHNTLESIIHCSGLHHNEAFPVVLDPDHDGLYNFCVPVRDFYNDDLKAVIGGIWCKDGGYSLPDSKVCDPDGWAVFEIRGNIVTCHYQKLKSI